MRIIIFLSPGGGGGLFAKSSPSLVTLWTVAHQAPLSMGFSRQEHWSQLPFSSPEDLPGPGTEPRSSALQADSLPTELWGELLLPPRVVIMIEWANLQMALTLVPTTKDAFMSITHDNGDDFYFMWHFTAHFHVCEHVGFSSPDWPCLQV